MYEKDGEKYFVVDEHLHYWDASPENTTNKYGEGFISCFYDYHANLSPEEYTWSFEKYRKYSEEDLMHDIFEVGHVDVGIFQSTYLSDFYDNGFNTLERNALLAEKYPSKLLVNGSFDPRNEAKGLEMLESDHEKYGFKGVKLYTAEWKGDSRGWKLDDEWSVKHLEKCEELGIKNIHVHKGPTIWPLNRDAFDVADVDRIATQFTDLNFVVEHVGLPRLEDFCWIGTQEPNVYGGLAVAMPFVHAKPRYFAQIIGELLYWLGEDKILFASDYALWQPKWLVEKFVDFQYPGDAEFDDYDEITPDIKRKILGLNAAALYDLEVPEELQLVTAGDSTREVGSEPESPGLMIDRNEVLGALSGVRDPELDEPITDLDFVSGLEIEDGAVHVRLRLPTYFCAPNFSYLMVADAKDAVLSVPGVESVRVVLEDHYASEEINSGVNEERGFDNAFDGETEGPDLEELRTTFRRKAFVSRQEQLCRALMAEGRTPADLADMVLGGAQVSGEFGTYLERRAELGLDVSKGAPLIVDPDGNRVPKGAVVQHLRFARLTRVSIEGNAGLCRGLLETRYGASGVAR